MWTALLALVAAAVAAYTAVLKTKHEKLWMERYEKSANALVKANVITRFLESEESGDHHIHGLTTQEKKMLDEQWVVARQELFRDIAYLGVLFPKSDFIRVNNAWSRIRGELFMLLEESSPHDRHTYVRAALPKAREFESVLIDVIRLNCVEPALFRWMRRGRSR